MILKMPLIIGWTTSKPEFNWATLRDNKTKEIERLNSIYVDLLEQSGVP